MLMNVLNGVVIISVVYALVSQAVAYLRLQNTPQVPFADDVSLMLADLVRTSQAQKRSLTAADLLLTILNWSSADATAVLNAAGVDLLRLRANLERRIEASPQQQFWDLGRALTASVSKCMTEGMREASRDFHLETTTRDILLGSLRMRRSPIAKLLKEAGATNESLRVALSLHPERVSSRAIWAPP